MYGCSIPRPSSKPLCIYSPSRRKSSSKGSRSDHPTCAWPLMPRADAFFGGKWVVYCRASTARCFVAYSLSGLWGNSSIFLNMKIARRSEGLNHFPRLWLPLGQRLRPLSIFTSSCAWPGGLARKFKPFLPQSIFCKGKSGGSKFLAILRGNCPPPETRFSLS